MSDAPRPAEEDPAGDWLKETFPEPEPWPEPLPADRGAPDPEYPRRSRTADVLRGAGLAAAAFYTYDALTEDEQPPAGADGSAPS